MKNLKEKAKIDNAIISALKLTEIRHIIAHTNKGDLCLMLPKDGLAKDYRFVLDAVPYDDKTNSELMALFNGILFTM